MLFRRLFFRPLCRRGEVCLLRPNRDLLALMDLPVPRLLSWHETRDVHDRQLSPVLFRFSLRRWRLRILDLDPMLTAAGAVRRAKPLRHDALVAVADMLEDICAVAAEIPGPLRCSFHVLVGGSR